LAASSSRAEQHVANGVSRVRADAADDIVAIERAEEIRSERRQLFVAQQIPRREEPQSAR
jgi:hypothetical protein